MITLQSTEPLYNVETVKHFIRLYLMSYFLDPITNGLDSLEAFKVKDEVGQIRKNIL